MSSHKRGSKKFPANPLVERLQQTGYKGPMVQLVGYIGSTSPDGMVQIHPTLEDLSQYLEVSESDIIHVEQTPESVLPHGGSWIWLKAGAEIKHTAEPVKREARFLAGDIARGYMPMGPSLPPYAGEQVQGFEPPAGVVRVSVPGSPCPDFTTRWPGQCGITQALYRACTRYDRLCTRVW